jgi:hypothetical protein
MKMSLSALVWALPLAFSTTASAGFFGLSGAQDVPEGSLCCIHQTCLLAQSEADCKTAGGQTVPDCATCTGKTAESPASAAAPADAPAPAAD